MRESWPASRGPARTTASSYSSVAVSTHRAVGRQVAGLTAAGEQLFDQVVVTLAAPLAAKICIGLSDEEVERLQGIVYQGLICASVLMRRPLAGHYVTYITDDAAPVHRRDRDVGPGRSDELGGQGLVYLPRYVTADDPYWHLADAEVEQRFLDALQRMYPFLERRRARLSGVAGPSGPGDLDARLFRPLAADDHVGCRTAHRQLGAHRQRHAQRQRDGRAGRGGGAAPAREPARTLERAA